MLSKPQRELTPQGLKIRRRIVGLSQDGLAAQLNCSVSTIRNYEHGRVRRLYSVDMTRLWEILDRLPSEARNLDSQPA